MPDTFYLADRVEEDLPVDLVPADAASSLSVWNRSNWKLRATEHDQKAALIKQPGVRVPFSIRETALLFYVVKEGLVEVVDGKPKWRTVCKEPEAHKWFKGLLNRRSWDSIAAHYRTLKEGPKDDVIRYLRERPGLDPIQWITYDLNMVPSHIYLASLY